MNPTPKLRFVERKVAVPYELQENVTQTKTVHILQQWCEDPKIVLSVSIDWNGVTTKRFAGEWRDVPIEKEQA